MEKAFEVTKKAFFIIFKGLSIAKKGFRHESAPLSCRLSVIQLKRKFTIDVFL